MTFLITTSLKIDFYFHLILILVNCIPLYCFILFYFSCFEFIFLDKSVCLYHVIVLMHCTLCRLNIQKQDPFITSSFWPLVAALDRNSSGYCCFLLVSSTLLLSFMPLISIACLKFPPSHYQHLFLALQFAKFALLLNVVSEFVK